jgi:zinc transporter ZupT
MYFLVVDHRLLELHKSSFLSTGRWVLSAAIPLGWAIGLMTVISPPIVTFLLSFVAGSMVLMVIQEEYSETGSSSFPASLVGICLYSALVS